MNLVGHFGDNTPWKGFYKLPNIIWNGANLTGRVNCSIFVKIIIIDVILAVTSAKSKRRHVLVLIGQDVVKHEVGFCTSILPGVVKSRIGNPGTIRIGKKLAVSTVVSTDC